jgi:ribosome maturation factor RimP
LFKCTYTETDRPIFDKEAFIKFYGEEVYAKFSKTTAVFSIKTTSR